ncbi:MAG TPA: hypothetical protein VHW73_10880 [Rudaea sp.]|nr:hypothetical protein [Rudaea sp.]
MATFEKRVGKAGKTTWRVKVRRQSGPSLTKSFKRKADADEWARSVEHKLDTGEHVPNSEARKRTLGDAIDRYLEVTLPRSKHKKNESEQTRLLNVWKMELRVHDFEALVLYHVSTLCTASSVSSTFGTGNPQACSDSCCERGDIPVMSQLPVPQARSLSATQRFLRTSRSTW